MEWKINKSAKVCIACNKEFFEEEEYYSALSDENNTFIRKDFCVLCWGRSKDNLLFSFWKTRMPRKDAPVQRFVNIEIFLDMFVRLEGDNDPQRRNLRYVLALYLIRKKIFKLKSVKRQDGEEFITLYYPQKEQEFNIFNPRLKEEEIEAITAEISRMLDFPYLEHEVLSATN